MFMLLRAYIDDSSDQRQERVAVAGAYLGSFRQWSQLVQQWKRRLKRSNIKFWHSTDYYSLRGEFEQFRHSHKYPKPSGSQAAKQVRDDLDAIIHECHIVGIAACVPLRLYRHIRNQSEFGTELMPADPFDYAIQELFLMCAQEVLEHRQGDTIAFVCDESTSVGRIAEIYTRFKELNPNAARAMGALVHRDDKQCPQLQAADLMAHIAKERFAGWMIDRSTTVPHDKLRERLKNLSVYRIGIPERERLLEFVRHEAVTRGFF